MEIARPAWASFDIGDLVRKRSGSNWHGRVVGYYSTELTPRGICVESDLETGSVQVYPEAAFERRDRATSRERG